MTALVYLAVPIDNRTIGDDGAWGEAVALLSEARGVVIYDPRAAFTVGDAAPDGRLQTINMTAIEQCDAMVALLPGTASSVGVPIEIDRASRLGKPVFVWRHNPSWMLASLPNTWTFSTVDGTIQALLDRLPELCDRPVVPRYAGAGRAPRRTYGDDAGFDLFAYHAVDVEAFEEALIPAGVAVEWPAGYWGMLVGRSSTFHRGLLVNTGIIDPGFRGELFAVVRNITNEVVQVHAGDRIAQLIPLPAAGAHWGLEMIQAKRLSDSHRGTNGFGSSGR